MTQWRDFIALARFEPPSQMTAQELDWLRKINITTPSTGGFHKLAAALAMNKQPIEAQLWLRRACKIVSATQCEALRSAWAQQSLSNPDIAAVAWPVANED